jgi:hypothetical protein
VLLIDLSKAFDTIPHQRLLEELEQIGLGRDALQWFLSFLEGRKQRVSQDSKYSEFTSVTRGVPQGSCLSPLLFNIYVRKLPESCNADTVQFADDITASKADTDIAKVTEGLQEAFTDISQFCSNKGLVINETKTQMIVFKSPRRKLPQGYELKTTNAVLKPLESVKLLGVHLDQHFTMSTHIDKVTKKCHGLLGALSRATPCLTEKLLKLAYTALIRSHLEYASAIVAMASGTNLHKLEVIQKMAARVITGSPRLAHSDPLLQKLGLDPLSSRRDTHLSGIVSKILLKKCHPALSDLLIRTDSGEVTSDFTPRTGAGRKCFQHLAMCVFNRSVVADSQSTVETGRAPEIGSDKESTVNQFPRHETNNVISSAPLRQQVTS